MKNRTQIADPIPRSAGQELHQADCDLAARSVTAEELASLRMDKARLDWLERYANFIEVGHADISATRAGIDEVIGAFKA